MGESYYLEGERIYLRAVHPDDVNDRYCDWLNDPEVNQFLETRFIPQSLETIADYVRRHNSKVDEPFFAICLKESDEHIGNIKLGPINWIHRRADVSLFIGEKQYWSKGYAREAIDLISRHAFRTLNLMKLTAGASIRNPGSIKSFEKSGYTREVLLRSHSFIKGERVDTVLLGLLDNEYWEQNK